MLSIRRDALMAPGATPPRLRPPDFRLPQDIRGRNNHRWTKQVAIAAVRYYVPNIRSPRNSAASNISGTGKSTRLSAATATPGRFNDRPPCITTPTECACLRTGLSACAFRSLTASRPADDRDRYAFLSALKHPRWSSTSQITDSPNAADRCSCLLLFNGGLCNDSKWTPTGLLSYTNGHCVLPRIRRTLRWMLCQLEGPLAELPPA